MGTPLWSDVEDKATALVNYAAMRDSESVEPGLVEAHFMGAVVLKMSGSTPDLARQLRVIDGQQRLTSAPIVVGGGGHGTRRCGTLYSSNPDKGAYDEFARVGIIRQWRLQD